jgi:succinate dehydrogenase/fumarate reductase-like Fe-S protein
MFPLIYLVSMRIAEGAKLFKCRFRMVCANSCKTAGDHQTAIDGLEAAAIG